MGAHMLRSTQHPTPPPPPPHPAPYAPAPPHHSYCDPKAPPKCAEGSDLPYCVLDPEYPAHDIANKISQDALFLKKYADVADQSADDLVQDITKPQEESFDYKYYTGASKGPSPYDASHWIGPEGYLCPSDVDYAKITRAVNVEGYWRIILQHIPEGYGYGHYNYTQTTRLETCLFPDSACRLLAPVISPSVPRSMSTTECSLLILATHTEGSSSIHTSSPALALATFPPNLIQTKNQNQENHGLS